MRMLILACSATKIGNPSPVPAFHRYDGPAWRTLRANIDDAGALKVFALSAEHGLISAHRHIADYDRRMTLERGRALVPNVADALAIELLGWQGVIFAFGGGVYRDCLEQARLSAESVISRGIAIDYSIGGIGEQLGQLKTWLRREAA